MIQEPISELMGYMCWRSGEDVMFGLGVRVKEQIKYEEQHNPLSLLLLFSSACAGLPEKQMLN